MGIRKISLLCLLVISSGCAVGPDYKAPEIETAPEFKSVDNSGLSKESYLAGWWRSFKDQTLETLISQAIENNKDIDTAIARLKEARANRVESQLDLFPVIRANGAYETRKSATISGFTTEQGQTGNVTEQRDYFFGGFDATWELDFFGRVRREIESRDSEEEAREADLNDAVRSVLAEVAVNYLQLRGTQEQLRVARENARLQEESYNLNEELFKYGEISGLDTARAKAQWQNTLAIIPPLQASARAAVFRLAVLTGQQPENFGDNLLNPSPLPNYEGPVTIGNPGELLRRRPDVRAAERRLAAATADIGVQTADLFPKVTFTGSIGLQANSISNLRKSGNDFYNFGPGISWAAFDLLRVRQRIRSADARAEAQLAQFEKQVLVALEEVENALTQFSTERERRAALVEATAESRKAAELAKIQYDQGLVDFLTVLDAQRVELDAESQLARSNTACLTSIVAVYKAIGGGWEEFEVREDNTVAPVPDNSSVVTQQSTAS